MAFESEGVEGAVPPPPITGGAAPRAQVGQPTPATDEFVRRTGVRPPAGEIFDLGVVQASRINSDLRYGAEVGALGQALRDAEWSRSVVANGDLPAAGATEYRREAVASLMDVRGIVPAGAVGQDLLEADPSSPFGVRLDLARVEASMVSSFPGRSVMLVEASDLVRLERSAPLLAVAQFERAQEGVLDRTNRLVELALDRVDLARDAVVVITPWSVGESNAVGVIGVAGPGVEPGLISSGTTRRAGFAQTVDVAPTILSLAGVAVPSSMEGTPMERASAGGSYGQRRAMLISTGAAATFRDDQVGLATVVFVFGQLVLWFLTWLSWRRGGSAWSTVTQVSALSLLSFLPVTYLAGRYPFHEAGAGWFWLFLAVGSAAMGSVIHVLGRRDLTLPVEIVSGVMLGLLSIDILVGGPLQLNTVFGYTPTVAGRFDGIGNLAFGMLAASGITLAALLSARIGGRRGVWVGMGILAWCVVLDGFPSLGADVGGALTLVPSVSITAMMLLGWKIRWRAVLLTGVAALVVVIGFGLFDMGRSVEDRTHLGRLFARIGDDGVVAFGNVVARKLDANLSVLTSSVWSLAVPVVFSFVAWVFWKAPWRLRALQEAVPEQRAAISGLLVAMVLGFALNDSGIAVPGVIIGVVNASLVVLVSRLDQFGLTDGHPTIGLERGHGRVTGLVPASGQSG